MITKSFVLILLAICLFYYTNAGEVLTKIEARKLIEQYNNHEYPDYYIERFVNRHKIPDNIIALKEAGLIELVGNGVTDAFVYEVKLHKKATPYLIRQESKILWVRLVTFQVDIFSVVEKPIDENGESTCDVRYKETPTRTPFFGFWGDHCFDKEYMVTSTFRKGKDGWKLEEKWL